MKQIIPFKKELPFKTKVCEITSISLERDIDVGDDGVISGVFHITGDYKMNEGSINREDFSFDLPFDITLDPRYDIKTVTSDIEDFYYDVINEDTLKVNIDLFVEAEYLPESEVKVTYEEEEKEKEDNRYDDISLEIVEKEEDTKEEVREEKEQLEVSEEDSDDTTDTEEKEKMVRDDTTEAVEEKEEEIENIDITPSPSVLYKNNAEVELPAERDDLISASDLFSNLDDTETYTTYYVYIVKEDDTVDKILSKYGISKEDLEDYNDITEIKPGDKVIIPKKCE